MTLKKTDSTSSSSTTSDDIDELTGERRTINESESWTLKDETVLRYSKITDLCKEFLQGYKKNHNKASSYHYFELLNNMMQLGQNVLTIDFMDIYNAKAMEYDQNMVHADILFDIMTGNARLFLRAMRRAAYMILSEIHNDYANEIKYEFKVLLTNAILCKKEITEITSQDVGKLIYSENFVISLTSQKNFTKSMAWACLDCGKLSYKETMGFRLPRLKKCMFCNSENLIESDKDSITDTMQELKLQQKYERIVSGKIPKTIIGIIFGNDKLNKVNVGDICSVTGIVSIQRNPSPAENAIADYVIEILTIEPKPDDFLIDDDPELEARVKKFINPEDEDEGYQYLIHSIAPSVLGHEIIKEALLLQIAGSDVAYFKDNSRHRGEINILLCGDAATAKTKLATYVSQIYPRAVYSNNQVTKAGMTASVRMEKSGHAVLEAGIYLLGSSESGGLVVCDEMEKVPNDARWATSTCMDDKQILAIDKGPLHQNIQINCASLHIANPSTGESWNPELSIKDNTGFENWYLSRFCTWIVRDYVSRELDERKAQHFLNQFGDTVRQYQIKDELTSNTDTISSISNGNGNRRTSTISNESTALLSQLRKKPTAYINKNIRSVPEMIMFYKYIRRTFHPALDPKSKAAKRIVQYYLSVRPQSNQPGGPRVTMRQLGDLVRFTEASARIHCRNEVTEKDAQIAINLVASSIASSGFNMFTEEYTGTGADQQSYDNQHNQDNNNAAIFVTGGTIVRASDLLGNTLARTIVSNDLEVLIKKRRDRFHREIANKTKQFTKVIKHFGLTTCKDCHGNGSRWDGKVQQTCFTCGGVGGFTNTFDYNDVSFQLTRVGFNNQDIQDFMTMLLKKKLIRAVQSSTRSSSSNSLYSLVENYNKALVSLASIDANIDLIYESDLEEIKKINENNRNRLFNNPDLKKKIEMLRKNMPEDYRKSIREKLDYNDIV